MTNHVAALDELDRRIVAALQVNGRASWRRIAEVIGEPERTVARRAARLFDAGMVKVKALASPERTGRGDPAVLRLRCEPRCLRPAASELALHEASLWVYAIAEGSEAVAEVFCPPQHFAGFLHEDVSALPGLVGYSAHPVLHYFRVVDTWQPGILTQDQVTRLVDPPTHKPVPHFGPVIELDSDERAIMKALIIDGRATHEELAGVAGVSKATARRRVEALRSMDLLNIRAVVEPSLLGLPVEAVLWLKAAGRHVNPIGRALAALPFVRYAAAVTGEHQIVAQVAMPDKTALHQLLSSDADWMRHVDAMEVSLVVDVFKRSDVLALKLPLGRGNLETEI
ncbi:Lrp/AsnC family transcriptional regulator [Streptomyces atratus]|uniref:Lrp/AsnC family transcriptional regulator n=1 Tax=Streptomyces atratus TaxID=1893 RepID=UPI00224D016A|nr:Lrp/AsnC family transcriptional regulator [Streptomyces atratus]MCX5339228.1 Lrp/AsnC family transcriptional regulator [Streptomyces atratus]